MATKKKAAKKTKKEWSRVRVAEPLTQAPSSDRWRGVTLRMAKKKAAKKKKK
jgi:hypothetical protein